MTVSSLESLLGLLVLSTLCLVAVKANTLDFGGLLASVFIGYIIMLTTGFVGLTLIILFFIIGSIFTKFGYIKKKNMGVAQEKGGARGWTNTFANAGVATVMAVLGFFSGDEIYIIGFIGAVAVATSDTLATEIGLLSNQRPRIVTGLRNYVKPGTSGGITVRGQLGCILGALLIGLGAIVLGLTNIPPITILLVVTISGFVGSNFDSFVGASFQGQNRCRVCNELTEDLRHHGQVSDHVSGVRYIENNIVNLLGTAIGAITAILLILTF